MPAPSTERRKHTRHPLATSVKFFHGPTKKEFPGRCVDICHGGMLMYVPATAPVQAGHSLRLSVGALPRPEYHALEGAHDATIVRVDHHNLTSMGQLAVGIRFH